MGPILMEICAVLADSGLPKLEARLLLSHVLRRKHAWLVAHDRDELDAESHGQFDALATRRKHGEPVAYLLGEREFFGRTFRCTPAALIPRPETEHLVEHALTLVEASAKASILDVGTGTGCIAITLALERATAQITALDVSPEALTLARENAAKLNANNVEFIQSNWFNAVAAGAKFDLIVSNPPYIMSGDAHLTEGDLRFEPALALVDAIDGLESYRQLARGAKNHLNNGGWIIVEHGYDQGEWVPALLRKNGFTEISTQLDLAGHPRVTAGRWREPRRATPRSISSARSA